MGPCASQGSSPSSCPTAPSDFTRETQSRRQRTRNSKPPSGRRRGHPPGHPALGPVSPAVPPAVPPAGREPVLLPALVCPGRGPAPATPSWSWPRCSPVLLNLLDHSRKSLQGPARPPPAQTGVAVGSGVPAGAADAPPSVTAERRTGQQLQKGACRAQSFPCNYTQNREAPPSAHETAVPSPARP